MLASSDRSSDIKIECAHLVLNASSWGVDGTLKTAGIHEKRDGTRPQRVTEARIQRGFRRI